MNVEPNRTSDMSSLPPEAGEETAGPVRPDAPQQDGAPSADDSRQQAESTNEAGETTPPPEAEPVSSAPAEAAASPSETSDDAASAEAAAEDALASDADDDALASDAEDDEADDETNDDSGAPVQPLEDLSAEEESDEALAPQWYILKVQVNREESIRDALQRRVKIEGLDKYFEDIRVPTEDVAEFTKTGKKRIVKRKLYPGYIMVNMVINDDTWFLVRETPGIGDFTGSAGRPTSMDPRDVERILRTEEPEEGDAPQVKTAIPFKAGDRVRVKDGYFQNFEGDVESIDEANGRVTVMINIFGRSTPVELEHWQIEAV